METRKRGNASRATRKGNEENEKHEESRATKNKDQGTRKSGNEETT